jgi:hypothetical protein
MTAENFMAALVGPFYSDESLQPSRPSAADLDAEVARGHLLRVLTSDGVALYPTFQFDDDLRVLSGLRPVLVALVQVPAWSSAVWLCTEHTALDNLAPADVVRDSVRAPQVQQLARQWAALLEH